MLLRLLILVIALLASGCSVIDDILSSSGFATDQPAFANADPLPPLETTRFALSEGSDVVGQLQVIRTKSEDTFVDIARTYGLGYDELVAANPGVDPWLPGDDTIVLLPTRFVLPDGDREGLVLNIAAKRLFYFPEIAAGEPAVVETYPVGIGREGWATPTGDTTVISKARNPIWYVPASVRKEHAEMGDPLPRQVPPGPDNPLGRYVLGLGLPGYLIHGTNKPAGVGMRVSHGCVRLFPEHIEGLYPRIGKGVRVRIVNQPYLIGRDGDEWLFEAHAPLVEDERDWSEIAMKRARAELADAPANRIARADRAISAIAGEHLGVPQPLFDTAGMMSALRAARLVENTVVFDKLADRTID